jgi:hypothetical protein
MQLANDGMQARKLARQRFPLPTGLVTGAGQLPGKLKELKQVPCSCFKRHREAVGRSKGLGARILRLEVLYGQAAPEVGGACELGKDENNSRGLVAICHSWRDWWNWRWF